MTAKRSKRGRHATKPKKTISGIKRAYGVPVTAWMRYKNPIEKGIYWHFFSLAIRKRDVEKWGGCISCGREITVYTCDAGHFIPAASCGPLLLFHLLNVNAECSRCNAWDDLHLLGYAKGLDRRYGEGTAEKLLQSHRENKAGPVVKDFKREEYKLMINKLKTRGL